MRKLLVLAALAGAAAVAAKKLMGKSEPVWHTPDADADLDTGSEPVMSVVPDAADDAAGAGPDEALADSAEAPHAVTTPDAPLEETDLSKE